MSDIAPKNGEFQDGKLWFRRKGSTLTVGLTDVGVEDIGTAESVELPDSGDDFDKGDIVVTVSGSNGSVEVSTPAAGIIQEINENLQDEPDSVTEDPLEEGWLFKLEIQDTSDLKEFADKS